MDSAAGLITVRSDFLGGRFHVCVRSSTASAARSFHCLCQKRHLNQPCAAQFVFCIPRNVLLSSHNCGCVVCCENASFEVRSVRSHSCPFITRTYRYELPTRAAKNGVCGDSTDASSQDCPKKSLQNSSLQCSLRGQQQAFFGCLVLAKTQHTPLVHRSSQWNNALTQVNSWIARTEMRIQQQIHQGHWILVSLCPQRGLPCTSTLSIFSCSDVRCCCKLAKQRQWRTTFPDTTLSSAL